MSKLTFETIRKTCVPGMHVFVDPDKKQRLYIGFSSDGRLVVERLDGNDIYRWPEEDISDWTIEPYEPPKKTITKRFWIWRVGSKTCAWAPTDFYVDEEGKDTCGDVIWSDWDKMEKQKIEDDWIELEVKE